MSDRVFLDPDLTDGGKNGQHPPGEAIVVAVGPSTDTQFNRIRWPLRPVACWRMDDVRFDFGSSFLLPEAKKEITILRELLQTNPGSPLSVFGHADPTGNDEFNKKLSGRRARIVYALLIRNTDMWADTYDNPIPGDQWGVRSTQIMLDALGLSPGPIDGKTGEQTRKAVAAFQSSAGLPPDGEPGPATRKKLFRAYMDFLCQAPDSSQTILLTKTDFLARGADANGKGDFQGCSEFNPVLVFSQQEEQEFKKAELKTKRDTENMPNRRVTIFLFAKGALVDAGQWPCPRWNEGTPGCRKRFFANGEKRRNPQAVRRLYQDTKDTFACRFYDRFANDSPCEGSDLLTVFRLRLCDYSRNPIAGAPSRITQGERSIPAVADADGFITVIAKKQPNKLLVEWKKPDRADGDDYYPYELDFFVAPGSGDEGGFQRLHNVGYRRQPALQEKVKAFQRDFGRPITGNLADIEAELNAWHDGGPKPQGAPV